MFCKTTYCALLLMIEIALVYNNEEEVEIDFLYRKHNIQSEEFDCIIKKLNNRKLITVIDGKVRLQMAPNKISIWQIVTDISEESVFTERYFDEEKPVTPTSAMIMLHKERENLLRMIENRLKRQKLSAWSERASKTIYI